MDPQEIVSAIQDFVGPILLLAIGIVAIKHLVTRQMTQFFQFIAVALLILLLFYTPGVLLAIVDTVFGFFAGEGQESGIDGDTGGVVVPQ